MKRTYTRKQIEEAIKYWQKQLDTGNYKKINESSDDFYEVKNTSTGKYYRFPRDRWLDYFKWFSQNQIRYSSYFKWPTNVSEILSVEPKDELTDRYGPKSYLMVTFLNDNGIKQKTYIDLDLLAKEYLGEPRIGSKKIESGWLSRNSFSNNPNDITGFYLKSEF